MIKEGALCRLVMYVTLTCCIRVQSLLKERLLSPLGMDDVSVIWEDVNVTSSKMARPYQKIRGALEPVDESLYE